MSAALGGAVCANAAVIGTSARAFRRCAMTPRLKIVLAIGTTLLLAACAAGTPDAARTASEGPISLIVLGFWHGLIAPITLIVEVVRKFFPGVLPLNWHLYETGAASVPYDVGFYFGLAGGPGILISRWR
jgi:hypothetical protein